MLDLRRLLRPGAVGESAQVAFDLSGRDFYGFTVPGPVHMQYTATPQGDAVRLDVLVEAELEAECARCLAPAVQPMCVENRYRIGAEELREEFPQLPIVNGLLDLEELAYGELVMETPASILCREDCNGLCQRCGLPAGQCQCPPQDESDPRWQALRDLLDAETENED